MKKLIFLFPLFLMCFSLHAQIGYTKEEIVEVMGSDYEDYVADDGTPFIMYGEDFETEASGEFTRFQAIYFTEVDGNLRCHIWKYLEPSSETNFNVELYNKELVEIGHMKWNDYENDHQYELTVEDGLCITWVTGIPKAE